MTFWSEISVAWPMAQASTMKVERCPSDAGAQSNEAGNFVTCFGVDQLRSRVMLLCVVQNT
jgi:hypothetical protein